jgi:transcriptional regulator with XRE-family HTH domain
MKLNLDTTGRQILDARELLGLSLSALATRAGINRVAIRLYEAAGDNPPDAHTSALRRLAHYFESAGIEFRPDGTTFLQRGVPLDHKAIHAEVRA